MKREYFNRWYGLKPYYAALVVSRTPATIFFSLIYLVIAYPVTSQPLEVARILMFTAICILVALISESMGTVISSMLSVVVSLVLSGRMVRRAYIRPAASQLLLTIGWARRWSAYKGNKNTRVA